MEAPFADPFDHLPDRPEDPFDHLPDASSGVKTAAEPEERSDKDEALYQEALDRLREAAQKGPQPPSEYDEKGNAVIPDNSEDGMQRRAAEFVKKQRAKEAEEKAFEESRTIPRRIGDALIFGLEGVPRTATGGKAGLADIAEGVGADTTADAIRMGLGGFARANETGLDYAKRAGDIALAVPGLNSLGAPLAETTGAAIAMRGRIPAEMVADAVAARARTEAGYLKDAAKAASEDIPYHRDAFAAERAARPNASVEAANKLAQDRAEDLAAFQRTQVPPFGPAFSGTASSLVAKPLSESIVGGPIRNALIKTIEATRDAGDRAASQYGEGRTLENAGTAVKNSLARNVEEAKNAIAATIPESENSLRDAGVASLDAIKRGLDERREEIDGIATNYGGALTHRDAGVGAQEALERFKDMRPDDNAKTLSDAELNDIISRPPSDTSIKTKQDAMYERAWRSLPEDEKKPSIDLSEIRKELKGIVDRGLRMAGKGPEQMKKNREWNEAHAAEIEQDPTLMRQEEPTLADRREAYPVKSGLLGKTIQDLMETDSERPLQDARNMRSEIRRLASGMPDTERNTLSSADLRNLQSAATKDIYGTLEKRAQQYEESGLRGQADKLRESAEHFKAADQFTKESAQRIDALEKYYKAESPEDLAVKILKDAQGNNLDRLSLLMDSLRPEERGDIAAAILREAGRPAANARGLSRDVGYSAQTALVNLKKIPQKARDIVFGSGEERAALEDFERANNRVADFERNYGDSTPESVAGNILSDMRSGSKANLLRAQNLLDYHTQEERNKVVGGLISELGRPKGGKGFSVNALADNLEGLSPKGRSVLVGKDERLGNALANFEERASTGLAEMEKIYGTDNPESIGQKLWNDAKIDGNIERLQTVFSHFSPEEHGVVASALLRELGRPNPGARGYTQDVGYSVARAQTEFNKLSPKAKEIIWGVPATSDKAKSLQDFEHVVKRIANFEDLANKSKSAISGMNAAGLGSIAGASGAAMFGHLYPALGVASTMLGSNLAGRALASQKYVNWLTRKTPKAAP